MHKLNIKSIPIIFIEDNDQHLYKNTETGEFFTGVTTIIKTKEKDWMKFWTIKAGVKYLGWFDPKETDPKEGIRILKEKLEKLKKLTPEEYLKVLDQAKKAWSQKSKDATDKGKLVHDWLEKFIADENPQMPEDTEVLSSVNAFLNWTKQHQIEWLASEMVVASMTHKFAGTLDFIAKIDGILTLGDFKTSNQISEDNDLQLAGYMIALQEMLKEGEPTPSQRLIIRVPKTGKDFEAHICNPETLDFDKETFLSLRQIHKWNIYHENQKNKR